MTLEAQPGAPDPRLKKHYYLEATTFRRVFVSMLHGFFSLATSLQVKGVENIPKIGPAVLAANHLTNFDVFPMQFVIPRPIFFMGKAELFENPVMDLLLRQLGGFPVVRGAQDEWAFEHALRVLDHDQLLGIFPEGKRSHGHGLRTAKSGAARLALNRQTPIIPVGVIGTDRMFKHFPRRTKVTILVGKPIYPQPGDSPLALTDRMMFALADLLPPRLRGVYAQRVAGF
jgi:1-acyl-sn-glycerol-3-phosphate acyltransferase